MLNGTLLLVLATLFVLEETGICVVKTLLTAVTLQVAGWDKSFLPSRSVALLQQGANNQAQDASTKTMPIWLTIGVKSYQYA